MRLSLLSALALAVYGAGATEQEPLGGTADESLGALSMPTAFLRRYMSTILPDDEELETEIEELAPHVQSMLKKIRNSPENRPVASSMVSKAIGTLSHKHPKFPNHGLRVKNPAKLGVDPDVSQLSGYLDVDDEDKHFFFWLFESRNDPKNDPVVLWLNGGPGCSSSTGEFFELGPSFVGPNGTLTRNENSWNANATVIFLDQPVNVGYSYSTKRVGTSLAAAEDVYSFLSLLFDAYPQYNTGQGFHIAGESYAGHYIPAIGQAILEHEERNFNLTSLLIGNPIVDARYQSEASAAMLCGEGGFPALYDNEYCTSLYRKVPRCESLLQACYDSGSLLQCLAAEVYCGEVAGDFGSLNRNPYDLSETCGSEENPCYPEINYIEEWLNEPYVKEAVGADVDNFVGCSNGVGLDFALHADEARNFAPALAYILNSGVPVLQMSGKLDWICNILGSRRFLGKMQWNGAYEFNKGYMKPWKLDGEVVGWSKSSSDLLTYLEIEGAGHMVPHNQPYVAKQMLDHWLAGHREF